MSIDFGNWAFRNSKLIYFLIAVLIVVLVLWYVVAHLL